MITSEPANEMTPNQRFAGSSPDHVPVTVAESPSVAGGGTGLGVTTRLPALPEVTTKLASPYDVDPPGVAKPLT